MKIADTLRHECMPAMVYSICKMCINDIEKNELQKLITLDDNSKPSQEQFNKVFAFAKECMFIAENNGIVSCKLNADKLNSFKEFRMQVFKGVFENRNTKFTKMVEWYLQKSSTDIFAVDTADALAALVNAEIGLGVDKFFALGFRFWMVDLGLAAMQNYRKSAIVFACHNIIKQILEECDLEKNRSIQARIFMNNLLEEGVVFKGLVSNNKINTALSMALRVLRDAGSIELIYVKDSSDVWHLQDSKFDVNNFNKFTEVIIRG